jgi:RNA polymerase sigma-70 factor (ECF subfamily)
MDSLRPLLVTYAYNILGSMHDAEDVVQDAFLNFMKINNDGIGNKKAYLVRTVINLSINLKKRRQKFKDQYFGQWLPEPVATEHADTTVNRKDILSYSLMVLLERLNPKQRAVFILKEAFDYDHDEIAEVLNITVENSRKILSRAKTLVHAEADAVKTEIPHDYVNRYIDIIRKGDVHQLEQLLNEDITVISDGGGKAVAFMNPIHGIKSVSAALLGIYKKFYHSLTIIGAQINHQPALFYYDSGKLVNCQVFGIENGHLKNIFFIRNPDKLEILAKNI